MSHKGPLERLEAHLNGSYEQVAWVMIDAAQQCQPDSACFKLCPLLGADEQDHCVQDGTALLVDASPALIAWDDATVRR